MCSHVMGCEVHVSQQVMLTRSHEALYLPSPWYSAPDLFVATSLHSWKVYPGTSLSGIEDCPYANIETCTASIFWYLLFKSQLHCEDKSLVLDKGTKEHRWDKDFFSSSLHGQGPTFSKPKCSGTEGGTGVSRLMAVSGQAIGMMQP